MILCVGKMKEKAYRQMADEYLKRLSRYGKYEETEIPDLPEQTGSAALEEQVKTREGEALLGRIRPGQTTSMRMTLVLPLWPLVLPPVMTTTSPGSRCSTSRAARRA